MFRQAAITLAKMVTPAINLPFNYSGRAFVVIITVRITQTVQCAQVHLQCGLSERIHLTFAVSDPVYETPCFQYKICRGSHQKIRRVRDNEGI